MLHRWQWIDGVIPPWDFGGGVYVLYRAGQVVYVGHTGNFRYRLLVHRRRFVFDAVKVAIIRDRTERKLVERRLLVRLAPVENRTIPKVFADINWVRERRCVSGV